MAMPWRATLPITPCGSSCRSKSHYARSCGRPPEPAGATARRVNPDVGEDGHSRVLIIGVGRELIHRLVLTAFDRPPDDGEQGRHRDGNPLNNHIANLRWGTQEDNWTDRKRHGNGRSYRKLTGEQAEAVRRKVACGHPAERVGREFGISGTQARNIARGDQWAVTASIPWPLPGVWCGVSVEDQQRADERISLLLQTPAAVRFLSCEPLLGPIRLDQSCPEFNREAFPCDALDIDWVIVGGESGSGARPCDIAWIRSVVKQCKVASVSVFVKQWGSYPCDGQPANLHQIGLSDRKGGDPSEWPLGIRVREFPRAATTAAAEGG